MPTVTVERFADPRRPDSRLYMPGDEYFWQDTEWGTRELHILSPRLLQETVKHPLLTRRAYPSGDNDNPSFDAAWGQDPDDRNGELGMHEAQISLIKPWLTPGALREMRSDFRLIADTMLDDELNKGEECFDLATWAARYTLRCAGRLLGIVLDEKCWLRLIIDHVSAPFDNMPRQWDMDAVIWRMIAERQMDVPLKLTLLDDIIHAANNGRLYRDHVVPLIWMTVVATQSTTAANIVSMLGLLDDAGQLSYVRDNLHERRVVQDVIEESVRFGQVFDSTPPERAVRDMMIGEVYVPKDTIVWGWYMSANRYTQDAQEFDITRRPNHHFGFSTNDDPHRCTGSAMARMMMEVALKTLLKKLPGLRRDPDGTTNVAVGLSNYYLSSGWLTGQHELARAD